MQAAADRARLVPSRQGTVVGRIGRFVLERFPPVGHGVLILALVLCGRASAALATDGPLRIGWDLALTSVATALAFLALRALDEIRDEADDRIGRPDRPLPRGLVSIPELRVLAAACTIAGAGIAAALGATPLACYALLVAQVWSLGRAERPGDLTRRRGLVGALIHSGIVPAALLFGWASGSPIAWGTPLISTLLLVWGAGLALEVGRKVVTRDEERDGVETYSAVLGRPRALALTATFLTTAAAGAALMTLATGMSPAAAGVPLGTAAAASVVLGGGRWVSTGVLRAIVPVVVIMLLLWPVALELARRPA